MDMLFVLPQGKVLKSVLEKSIREFEISIGKMLEMNC
jgi:hypothetical protein